MRSRVIAHSGFTNRGVHHGIDFLANANWLLGCDLMRSHSLHRVVASSHFGDNGVVIIRVKPSAIANLAAGFSVERSVVKNDFAGFSSLELLCALAVLDESQHFAAIGASLTIAFEFRFRKLLIDRVGRLLRRAFP